jgi:riboflavin kinase/FMN adenylyltransferase
MRIIKWSQFLEFPFSDFTSKTDEIGASSQSSGTQTSSGGFSSGVSSITVGVFDGVHRGHKALIERVVSYNRDYAPVIITFLENHKKSSIRGTEKTGAVFPGSIQTFRQRVAALEELGVKIAIAVEFMAAFRRMSGNEFLRILLERANVGFLAVGHNFRCGYKLDTDVDKIKLFFEPYNIPVEIIKDAAEDSQTISSSRIRALISRGDLEKAVQLLGRPFALDLGAANAKGVKGSPKENGYNFNGLDLVLPPAGEYKALLRRSMNEAGTPAELLIKDRMVCLQGQSGNHDWQFAEFLLY